MILGVKFIKIRNAIVQRVNNFSHNLTFHLFLILNTSSRWCKALCIGNGWIFCQPPRDQNCTVERTVRKIVEWKFSQRTNHTTRGINKCIWYKIKKKASWEIDFGAKLKSVVHLPWLCHFNYKLSFNDTLFLPLFLLEFCTGYFNICCQP